MFAHDENFWNFQAIVWNCVEMKGNVWKAAFAAWYVCVIKTTGNLVTKNKRFLK